jgi:flagellar protein FliO/FliZ
MLASLLLVLGAIFALAWLARWMQGARIARGAAMRLQGGVQLGTKEKVVLLQVGEQQFLLGVASGSVNLLHRFDEPVAAPEAGAPLPSAFAERLRQALGKTS